MANCANCGAEIERRNTASRLVACPYCDTTQMFVDDAFRNAGVQGVMQDGPSLFRLGETTNVEGRPVTPIGHARFSYGRGWWDEYWCDAPDGGLWISVDEGDIAIERPVPDEHRPGTFNAAASTEVWIGGVQYVVTERETAECVAVRGELPEVLTVGERHDYFDFAGEDGEILTLEQWEGQSDWYFGYWIDPWQMTGTGR